MKLVLFISIISFHVAANETHDFTGEARWQSSHKEKVFRKCSSVDEHGDADDNPRSYNFTDNKFDCNKLQSLKIKEFAEELLGSSMLNQQGILNAKEKDPFWKDSRQLGELLRAVAIKKVLVRHRDLLGVPMDSFDKNKCYQFKKGMGKINNQLKEGASDNPLTNQNHPLNPIRQHQLVHAAKTITILSNKITKLREELMERNNNHIMGVHPGTQLKTIEKRETDENNFIKDKILPIEKQIEDLMAANPFLSLDREKEWCIINCSDKLWEYQPWIEKIASMEPRSKELVEKIKYFMAKTSSDLKRSVNSLCQVYSDEGKLRTEIQKNYQEKRYSAGAWGKWALTFWDPTIFIGQEFRDQHDFEYCLSSIMESKSNDIAVKYIQQQVKENRKSKEIGSLISDQCKDETPFGWKNLMGMTSVLQEVTTKFGFSKFARCFGKEVDAISGVKENLALGLGLACVAAVPIAPVVTYGCGALDVAAMYSVSSDARIHNNQMSSCRAAPKVCDSAKVKASISKYYSAKNEFLLSLVGGGVGVIAEGVALASKASKAAKNALKVAKASKASETAKNASKVLDKFYEIERTFAQLPIKVTDEISKELKYIKKYMSESDKLKGLERIQQQIDTIRNNQRKAIRLAGSESEAKRLYKCLF